MDLGQNPICAPLLIVVFETVAPFWAIFDTLANKTFTLAWEKLVILDQI
jgi:hypothetical protein